jgi:hypothetical protein
MNTIRVLSITALLVGSFVGCKKDESPTSTTPTLQGDPFEIRAWDYSTNYFFVDTLYRSLYEPYYCNDPPVVSPATQIIEEEVWVQRIGAIPDPNEIQARSFIALSQRPTQGYDSTFLQHPETLGECESAPLVRLNRSQYEMMGNGYLGIISLRTQFQDNQVIAIAYRRADGTQFGDFIRDLSGTFRPVILKMVKPRNLSSIGSTYLIAWSQLLKSVYFVGRYYVREIGFELQIHYGSSSATQIIGHPLLRVLGLDRFNQDGTMTSSGDGQFDFRPGITIDQANGEIILPSLRPFDSGIRKYFFSRMLPPPDSMYYSPEIYDTTKTFAQIGRGNNYFFNGRALSY